MKPTISLVGARGAVVELFGEGDDRQIRASLSSDEPVAILPGIREVLLHNTDAVDMTRAARGLPLTVGHSEKDTTSPELPVGRIDNVAIEGGKLRGDLRFDTDARGEEVRGKVERGVAPDLSVTYRRLEWEGPDDSGLVTVTRWMPVAASVVSVPADISVGVGRSLETEATMPEEKTPEAGTASIAERVKQRTSAGFGDGQRAENARISEIQSAADMLIVSQPHMADELRALAEECRGDTTITVDAFRSAALELFGLGGKPLTPAGAGEGAGHRVTTPGDTRKPLIEGGSTGGEKLARGLELALLERAGHKVDASEMEGNQFRGWSLLDAARECIEAKGGSCRGMTSEQIARAAIRQGLEARAISPGTANYVTSDFPAITENVITKLLIAGYSEAPVTWNVWASSREVPDFKTFTIPRLSSVDDLPVVAENAAYTNLTRVDAKESATLVKHGGLFSLTWEAIVNDDIGGFNDQAATMGAAAARTVDKKVYTVLTESPGAGPVAGPVMGDTNQLFDGANHANVGSNALDLAGIVATRTAMARQTDDNSEAYYAMLRYILVPEELRDAADNLAGSEYLPWPEGTPGAQRVNTIRSTFTVVPTIRLTDANDWYGADAQNTVEVAFLAGNRSPALMRDEGWDTDAIHWKIRHPSVAYPKNWRGLYWNSVT